VSLTLINTEKYQRAHTGNNNIKDCLDLNQSLGYTIGALAGDGWVSKSKGSLRGQTNIAGTDDEVFNKVTQTVDSILARPTASGRTDQVAAEDSNRYGDCSRITMCSQSLSSFISDMIGEGCRNKHLPPFFLSAPLEFRQGLFAGLMDTDGSISVSNGKKKPQLMVNFTSTSLRLVQETMLLAKSLGVFARITPFEYRDGRKAWMLNFSTTDIKKYGCPGMLSTHKMENLVNTPVDMNSPSGAAQDMVPCPMDVIEAMWPAVSASYKDFYPEYTALSKAKKTGEISRTAALKLFSMLPIGTQETDLMRKYNQILSEMNVSWVQVTGMTNTGIRETGFDLTVPGYETFMSVEGIVLSNTMAIHVPVTDKAVKEAVTKMMPERNLFGARNFDLLYKPSQEYVQGAYLATRRPNSKGIATFDTEDEAIKAYRAGLLDANDPIRIRKRSEG
jgi:hypothetical protein